MVISGELGVGKSRLAAAFRDALVADGWTSSVHVASEARRTIPFSAFTALLDDGGDARNPLQHLLEGAARLDADGQPVLVHVEDGQWLDDESLAFLQQVAESTTATLLVTVRTGEPGSSRILELARTLGLRRLEVQPLSRAEVGTLLAGLVPGISRSEVRRLWEQTGGNPLYLHELVTYSLEAGGMTAGEDGLALAALDHTGLAEVVGGRLDDLDAGQLEAVELLAVAPGASLELLYRAAGVDGVVDLQRCALVVVVESGRRLVPTLAHPIYAEVVAARMGVATRRVRRRQVVAEVEARGARRGSDLVQSALWATEQGDAVDPRSLLAVARRLSGAFSEVVADSPDAPSPVRGGLQASAARLAKAAVAAGGGFEAAELWWKAESHRDSGSRAVAEALAAMYETAGTPEEHTRVAVMVAGLDLLLGRATPGEALEGLEALQRSAGSAELARTVDSWRVIHLTMSGKPERAVELGRAVLADQSTLPRDRLLLAGSLVGCLLLVGRTVEALATADELLGAIGVEDDQWDVGSLLLGRLLALSCMGRGDEADALVTQLMAISEATGNDAGVAVFGVARAQDAVFRGRPEDVLDAASRAVSAQRTAEAAALIGTHGPAHAALAHGHALLGHREEAAAALAEMARAPQQDLVFPMLPVLAAAWVAVLHGRRRSAVAALRAGVDDGVGGVPGRAIFLHELVRLGERGCGTDLRAVLDAGADGDLWEAFARHGEAFDADDGAGLDAASVELERLGHVLAAAEAAAQAMSCHAEAGDRAAAVAARERSRSLVERCQGAQTPALAVKSSALRDLAPRELGGGPSGRAGGVQQGDSRGARHLGAHRRDLPVPHLLQARRRVPRRAGVTPRALTAAPGRPRRRRAGPPASLDLPPAGR